MAIPRRLNSGNRFERSQNRDVKRVVFLSVEGNVTEPQYFGYVKAFQKELGIKSVVELHVLQRQDTSSSPFKVLELLENYLEIRNNSTNSNPFADGFLVLSKAQQGVLRVTRRLFGYCRKVAAARYVSSYSKPFGLLPKALPPGCSSEVGQPVYIEKEDIGLYPTSSLLVFLKSNLSPFG